MEYVLRAEFGMYPLWVRTATEMWVLEPEDYPVDDGLRDRILAWDDVFQATFNAQDPAASDFTSDEARAAYVDEGRDLLNALQVALRPMRVLRDE